MIQLIRRAAGSSTISAYSGTEGARFEQLDTGEWFIIIYMGQPSKEERKIVRKAKILTRYLIDESKTMVMALIRFESSPIIYELVFDPTRYKAIEWKDRIDWWDKSNTVSLLCDRQHHRHHRGHSPCEHAENPVGSVAGILAQEPQHRGLLPKIFRVDQHPLAAQDHGTVEYGNTVRGVW